MPQLRPVAGSKIYIGLKVAPKGTVALADFTAQEGNWTEIGGWTSAGSLGDTQEIVSQAVINEGRVRQTKGTRTGGTMENTFLPIYADAGQLAFLEAIDACKPYAFKVEWGAGCVETSTVTFTVDTPGVVNWAGHGLEAGSPVVFTNAGGALPAALTSGTTYYVIAAGLTATEFSVADTPGGAGIDFVGAGTGTHTATANPAGETDLFYGLALPGSKSGGDANSPQLRSWSIAVDSNIVEV